MKYGGCHPSWEKLERFSLFVYLPTFSSCIWGVGSNPVGTLVKIRVVGTGPMP